MSRKGQLRPCCQNNFIQETSTEINLRCRPSPTGQQELCKKPKYFNSNEYKKFSTNPEEAIYIGDINVYGYHIDIDNKFNEAQEYVDISYPRLAHILKKGTIQKTTNEK